MVSQPDKTGDSDKRQEVVVPDDRQYELAAELIELHRERHELARRFLEIAQQMTEPGSTACSTRPKVGFQTASKYIFIRAFT